MKIKNDFYCQPVREGHVYKLVNESGWMTVVNYELPNGTFINLSEADIDSFSNRDQFDVSELYGMPLVLLGASDVVPESGRRFVNIPGTALFGVPLRKRMVMTLTSRRFVGLNMIFGPDSDLPRIGGDPDLRTVLADLKGRLGTGIDRPFRVPNEMRVIAESVLIELETNKLRNVAYMGKRISQMIHLLYRTDVEFFDPPDVGDNRTVDRICLLLTEDLSRRPTVKEVCESEGVDQFWFIRNFKKRYGMTPTEHAVRCRQIRAAALLLTGEYTVAEVVGMVGYSSRSKFTTAFRQVHGCNPQEYLEGFDRMVEGYGTSVDLA